MRTLSAGPMHQGDGVSEDPVASGSGSAVPIEVARSLNRYFADALHEIRRCSPFDRLTVGPWTLLVQIAVGWARGDSATTQDDLAAQTGCSVRSLRRMIGELRDAGVLAAVRDAGGVGYRVGPRLEALLRDFAWGRDPRIWTRGAQSLFGRQGHGPASVAAHAPASLAGPSSPIEPPANVAAHPSASVAGPASTPSGAGAPGPTPFGALIANNLERIRVTPSAWPASATRPDTGDRADRAGPSDSPLIKKKISSSLSSSPETGTPPASDPPATLAGPSKGPRKPLPLEALRAAAFRALAARFRQAYPDRPVPASFPADDIAMLVGVTADGTLTEAELDQEHLDAIAGASKKSRNQPPTVRFVWGNGEYFLQNAKEGRALRAPAKAPVRKAKPKETDERPATFAELAQIGRCGKELLDRLPDVQPARPRSTRFLTDPEPTPE